MPFCLRQASLRYFRYGVATFVSIFSLALLFQERLSQSALVAAMNTVSDATARQHYNWLTSRGMRFVLGKNEATDLTEGQVLEGLKMYDAAVRMAHGEFFIYGVCLLSADTYPLKSLDVMSLVSNTNKG
jgi:hypothetical protein